MQTPLLSDEHVVKHGSANCQREWEAVGGHLFCTNHRLIFEPHSFNIQTGATIVELSQIVEAKPVWTKFLGVMPLAPNSFEVMLRDGTSQSFVVWGRQDWITTVERAKVSVA